MRRTHLFFNSACASYRLLLVNSYQQKTESRSVIKPDSKILDDIARMAGGAVSLASSVQRQIRDEVRSHVEDMANRMDLVPRADLDQALEMIADLRSRVEALEKQKTSSKKTVKKTVKKKNG